MVKTMIAQVVNEVLGAELSYEQENTAEDSLLSDFVPSGMHQLTDLKPKLAVALTDLLKTLSATAAQKGLGHGVADHCVYGVINRGRLKRIAQLINSPEQTQFAGRRIVRPDWRSELAYVLEGKGKEFPVTVVCDVYAEDRKRNKKYAFELKAPLPNSDQTKVSKEKLIKLYSMEPRQIDAAYYALPYNPYGRRENYAWSFPARWFNMKADDVVLIGDEFWEKIGGLGTYKAFIDAVNEIGPKYKDRIYREFLGIEPPHPDTGRL